MDATADVKAEPVESDAGEAVRDKAPFQVNKHLIPAADLNDADSDLKALGLAVYNQDDFEQGVMEQVDQALVKEQETRKKNALKKDLKSINDDIRNVKHELASLATTMVQLGQGKSFLSGGANRRLGSTKRQKENKESQLKTLEARRKVIQAKLDGKQPLEDEQDKVYGEILATSGNADKDKLIRTGEMTPFGTVVKQETIEKDQEDTPIAGPSSATDSSTSKTTPKPAEVPATTITPRKDNFFDQKDHRRYRDDVEGASSFPGQDPDMSDGEGDSGDEWQPEEDDQLLEMDVKVDAATSKGIKKRRKHPKHVPTNRPIYRSDSDEESPEERAPRAKAIRKYRDDGNEDFYDNRMSDFQDSELMNQKLRQMGKLAESDDDEEFDGGLKVPGRIWSKLYKYQKTCVKWLWELHCQQAGGIVGDEMGLGKTIQCIAFLAALRQSKLANKNFSHRGLGPCLIVCPATVMHQWVKEFHIWWPLFRVAILHSSGTFVGKEKELIHSIARKNGVLITSYTTLVIHQEALLAYNWHYIILDEGHKIRNPDVQATLVCKQFRSPHRMILSGSPIQNNLKELWSLMDFVFPGKLGTLPDFLQHFACPIQQGGFANASSVQVQTAYKCACVLRDTINPYLLRRMKADVKSTINLPGKNEQVLFCRLTDDQKEVYQEYLDSRECQAILSGRFMIFAGLITLRKICNHPDLSTGGPRVFRGDDTSGDPSLEYGFWRRSGKMIVVEALLKLWKRQGHKALLFSQGTQMLDILESFVQHKGYNYIRMDGKSTIAARQPLVQRYNNDPNIYLFLLTTRVGGLGINLTGANRIIIFDPDWNPSTDMQARERAWRIGQKRQVTIYRLLTTGTIEEKIYHRQIYKQFLTNRVLKDPKQRRLFKTNDMFELFSLGLSDDKGETETAAIFAGTGSNVSVKPKKINRFDRIKERQKKEEAERITDEEDDAKMNFDDDEIRRMRDLARKLSQKMEQSKKTKLQDAASTSVDDSNSVPKSRTLERPSSTSGSDSKRKSSEENKSSDKADIDKSVTDQRKEYLGKYKIKKKPCSSKENLSDKKTKGRAKSNSVHHSNGQKKVVAHEHKREENGSMAATGVSANGDNDVGKRPHDEDRRDKHKKKRKKHKNAKFDGERIPHLDKLRDYKPKTEEETRKENEEMDDYVLHRLFKKTGIQGALRHDKIMEPGQSDYVIVETEADKVAKEASLALKRSRSLCLPATAGVPSWTGHHGGLAKRPRFGQKKNTMLTRPDPRAKPGTNDKDGEPKHKDLHFDGSFAGSVRTNLSTGASVSGAASSSDLLSQMRVRNEVVTKSTGAENDEEDDDNGENVVTDMKAYDLIKRIREFILFECKMIGQATTKELLDEFGSQLPSSDSAKFRSMLNSICDLEKSSGQAIWKLRRDFR